jgi:hypothetical protein
MSPPCFLAVKRAKTRLSINCDAELVSVQAIIFTVYGR